MAEEYKCGPETDSDFFNELQAVFDKFPDAAQKYAIKCTALENEKILEMLGKDTMRLDFQKQVGTYWIKGYQTITEYEDNGGQGTYSRSGVDPRCICLEWVQISPGQWICELEICEL